MIISELRTVEHRARVAQVAKEEQRSTDDVVVSLAAGMRASEIKLLAEPNVHTWEELEKPSSFDTLQSRVIAQPTYDLVAYLSGRVAQAYETEATLNDLIEKNGHGRNFKYFTKHTDAGFGYTRGETAVLCFRGTVPSSLRQWYGTNLRMREIGIPPRHSGFDAAWQRLRPEVEEWLSQREVSNLILTGHSLGGAIAVLAAYTLAERFTVRAVVTFGAPRVGSIEFRNAYLEKQCGRISTCFGEGAVHTLAEVTRRITHLDDLVSRVPPPPRFRHVGGEWKFNAAGKLVPGNSRSVHEQIVDCLDQWAGWICRHMLLHMNAPVAPTATKSNTLSEIKRRLPQSSTTAHPTRGHALTQVFTALRNFVATKPAVLSLLGWQGCMLIVGMVGAIYATWCVVRSALDFYAHKSGLYQMAFLKNYRAINLFNLPTGNFDVRTGAEASLARVLEAIRGDDQIGKRR